MQPFKLKPEIKARWLAALRSGDYKQGRNYLRSRGTHCCLGVLCELAVQDGIAYWQPGVPDTLYTGKNYRSAIPQCEIQKWARASDDCQDWELTGPSIPLYVGQLTILNDTEQRSFASIADEIEKHW